MLPHRPFTSTISQQPVIVAVICFLKTFFTVTVLMFCCCTFRQWLIDWKYDVNGRGGNIYDKHLFTPQHQFVKVISVNTFGKKYCCWSMPRSMPCFCIPLMLSSSSSLLDIHTRTVFISSWYPSTDRNGVMPASALNHIKIPKRNGCLNRWHFLIA